MLSKLLFILLFLNSIVSAVVMEEGNLFKEKQELLEIKDELNDFYELKELEYQKNKQILETIQKDIKSEEASIQKLRTENKQILDQINRTITTKAMTLYDKLKIGIVVNIFNEMIKDDQIDEVFDILIRLKDKRVMKIMKKFDSKTTTILMIKMRIYKEKKLTKK